jgi:spore coat protein U-like protein
MGQLARRFSDIFGFGGSVRQRRSFLFLLAATLLSPVSARAVCTTISGSGLSFGAYMGATVTNSAATITIGCTNSFQFSAGLNAGTGPGATVATRKMTSGANTLNYQMFKDAAHSSNWGNTLNTDANAGTTSGASTALTIYAQLLAAQYPTPGTYTDSIIATEFNSGSIHTNFTVNVTVQPTCSFTTNALAFGIYTGTAISGTGSLVVTCTNTTGYQIGINGGLHSSGSYNWNMSGTVGALANYSLYRDSAHTQLWGGTIGAGGDTINGSGNGSAQTITFYGAVPAAQLVAPGAYSDTVNVILYY